MTNFDDYFTDDSIIKLRAYKEYQLDKTDRENIQDIQKMLKENRFNKDNINDSINYIESLYRKICQVKENEYSYEGANNANVNEYLKILQEILKKLEEIKQK